MSKMEIYMEGLASKVVGQSKAVSAKVANKLAKFKAKVKPPAKISYKRDPKKLAKQMKKLDAARAREFSKGLKTIRPGMAHLGKVI